MASTTLDLTTGPARRRKHLIQRHVPEEGKARCAFSVIVPAYNEQLVLEETVERIVQLLDGVDDYEIVIVEDGCTDYTPAVAAMLRRKYGHVQHIHSRVRLGKGLAVSEGIRASRGRVVVLMDADMATDPEPLLDCIGTIAAGDADIVIGNRYHPESNAHRTRVREAYSRAYNKLVGMLLGSRLRDHQCGFKVFDGDAIRTIIPFVESRHFLWDTEVLSAAQWLGYDVHEVPIRWKEGAASKVDLVATPLEMLFGLLRLSLARRRWPSP